MGHRYCQGESGPYVTARELSQQPEARRKRDYRMRRRTSVVPSLVPEVPLVAAPNVPPAPAPQAPHVQTEAPSSAPPAPATTLPRVTLLETEVVHGDGAEAYAATLAIGADGEGAGGVPLVDDPAPPPAAPREPISREKAAIIGKLVGAYVGFGWGVLVHDHKDKLAAIAETLMRGHPELAALSPEQKFQLGFKVMVDTVEESAIALAIKYNIHIPYADEAIDGIGVGTATMGVVKMFTAPKNENERVRDAKDANTPPRPAAAAPDVPRNVPPSSRDNEPDIIEQPAVRATNRGPS